MKALWLWTKLAAMYGAVAVKNAWRKARGLPPIERDLLGAGALPLMRGVTFTHGAWAVRALADAS